MNHVGVMIGVPVADSPTLRRASKDVASPRVRARLVALAEAVEHVDPAGVTLVWERVGVCRHAPCRHEECAKIRPVLAFVDRVVRAQTDALRRREPAAE